MPDQPEAPIVRPITERLQAAVWKLCLSATSVDHDVRAEADDAAKEAAEIIRLCEEALRQIESFAPIEGPTPPYVQIATFAKQTARLALAQIKGQNP